MLGEQCVELFHPVVMQRSPVQRANVLFDLHDALEPGNRDRLAAPRPQPSQRRLGARSSIGCELTLDFFEAFEDIPLRSCKIIAPAVNIIPVFSTSPLLSCVPDSGGRDRASLSTQVPF